MPGSDEAFSASFRDPSGFVFVRDGVLYRQVNAAYHDDYEHLIQSGLYDALTTANLLVPHTETERHEPPAGHAFVVLRPEPVSFISYPYEWCFGQLQAAAQATLEIQKRALEHDMSLKDASAYNIQWHRGRPVLIDTLSFERYREGRPWTAYRQFCQHFLAPLVLMSRVDVRLGQLARIHIDGVPLDLASRLLPRRTRFVPALLSHIHLHAAAQQRFAGAATHDRPENPGQGMSRNALRGLIDSLEGAVRGCAWQPEGTVWGDYYGHTNYTPGALDAKERLVAELLDAITPRPETVWDLGANTGRFSRIASGRGIPTVAWDIDPAAVEKNFRECQREGATHLLPLLQDLTNPSPDLGWAQSERMSLRTRGPAGLVLALALIHHLAIGNNVPLGHVSRFFRDLGQYLIVEFVPKSDSQVQRLLSSREDIFGNYQQERFEAAFRRHFTILRSAAIPDTQRTLYLMKRQDNET